MSTQRAIDLTINAKRYQRLVEARMTLADFLRHDVGLTGTHVGCEHGLCGACTILFNGEAVRSCLLLAVQADGSDLTTIEGLCASGQLSPLQLAFQEQHALQCGFCTSGMLVAAHAFLKEAPRPTEAQVREAISGNICRCTGYQPIIKAILQAAETGENESQTSEVKGQLTASRS
jgi:carbon-monoxide dehydrogenase small subunit